MIIPVLTAASGLDIFLRNSEGSLTDPTSITYDIAEPAGSLVADDAVPFQIGVGRFDARTTIIPSGFDLSSPWKITWSWTSPGGITSSRCEEFTVSGALEAFFDDIVNIRKQVRLDTNLSTTEMTDANLNVIIQKSIDRLNFKLKLQGTSGQLAFDTGTGQITPTPNSTIRSFIVMQADCLIVKRRQSDAARKGKRVVDARWQIDTTAGSRGHRDTVRSVCEDLDKCIEEYLRQLAQGQLGDGGAGNHGDLIWAGNSRIFEEADHDGQDFCDRNFRSPFGCHGSNAADHGGCC